MLETFVFIVTSMSQDDTTYGPIANALCPKNNNELCWTHANAVWEVRGCKTSGERITLGHSNINEGDESLQTSAQSCPAPDSCGHNEGAIAEPIL